MSISSSRTIQVEFSGDVTQEVIQSSLVNDVSPGQTQILTLAEGDNTITPPSVSGIVVTGLTIIPPSANEVLITLKGAGNDEGIPLHPTDPTSLGLYSGFSTFVMNADEAVAGVRLVWS
jgi:hypothetical protein